MSFKQKTWKDRISEHPARRTLTDVSNNTTKTVDVAREEGTISQEGDAYSAANMNDLEQRVADGFSTLSQDSVKIATKNTTSDSIAFGIDSNGNYGYIKEGADTVTPFKSQKDIDNAYNSGVAAADARVNTSSASYNSGYANGWNACRQAAMANIWVSVKADAQYAGDDARVSGFGSASLTEYYGKTGNRQVDNGNNRRVSANVVSWGGMPDAK